MHMAAKANIAANVVKKSSLGLALDLVCRWLGSVPAVEDVVNRNACITAIVMSVFGPRIFGVTSAILCRHHSASSTLNLCSRLYTVIASSPRATKVLCRALLLCVPRLWVRCELGPAA